MQFSQRSLFSFLRFFLSLYLFPISHRCFQSEGEERRRQAAPLQRWLRRARSSFLQRVLPPPSGSPPPCRRPGITGAERHQRAGAAPAGRPPPLCLALLPLRSPAARPCPPPTAGPPPPRSSLQTRSPTSPSPAPPSPTPPHAVAVPPLPASSAHLSIASVSQLPPQSPRLPVVRRQPRCRATAVICPPVCSIHGAAEATPLPPAHCQRRGGGGGGGGGEESRERLLDGAAQHHPEDQAQGEGDAHPHGVGAPLHPQSFFCDSVGNPSLSIPDLALERFVPL
uniref:Uncharacterized protein n=1 Tax=Oryza rufipogon TaxID=4529 RepID=A0A0E0NE09_ORYRU